MTRMAPAAALAASAAAAPTNANVIWPGISAPLAEAAMRVLRGDMLLGDSRFQVRHHSLYHRLPYPTTGSTAYQFFNAQEQEWVTNVPAGVLPNEQAFIAHYLRVNIVNNVDAATGGTKTAAASYVTTPSKCLVNAEELIRIIHAGRVKMRMAERTIVEMYGLRHFGAGCGPVVQMAAAAATTQTTTSIEYSVGAVNNGLQVPNAGYVFPGGGLPIPGGKKFDVRIDFQSALPLTDGGAIEVELEGLLVQPSNT